MKLEHGVLIIGVIGLIIIVVLARHFRWSIEGWFSGFALVVSVTVGVISWMASNKANNLQHEVLSLAKEANEFEVRRGEILLMSLLGRYFVIQFNCWEPGGKIRTDPVSVEQYIQGLRQLGDEVDALTTNPFYVGILEKYPEMNLLWITLRGFVVEIEQSRKAAVSTLVFDKFYDLYEKVKKEVAGQDMLNSTFYVRVDEAAKFLKEEVIPQLKPVAK